MDGGTAGCKQKRYEKILNVMKKMVNGRTDLMLNAMMCEMIKVGLKKDSFVDATKSMKIKIGWKNHS